MTRRHDEREFLAKVRRPRLFGVIGGWMGISTGITLSVIPFWLAGSLERGSASWYVVALTVLAPVSLVYAVGVNRTAGKHMVARMRTRLSADEPLEEHGYVLYLRPFGVDGVLFHTDRPGGGNIASSLASYFAYSESDRNETWEDRLVRLFWRFGQVVAVGRPGEPYPLPGARRFYLPDAGEDWKGEVSKAIRRARLVVLVAAAGRDASRAAGTLWEYTEAVRLLPPSRLLLVVCDERAGYERFRAGAREHFARRGARLRAENARTAQTAENAENAEITVLPPAPALPEYPRLSRPAKLRDGFPVRGVVHFDDHWRARLTPFDPTAQPGATQRARWKATVRTVVDPFLDTVERSLPGETVRPTRFRWHWHLAALLVLGYGLLIWLALIPNWDRLLVSERAALCGTFVYSLLTAARIATSAHDVSRSDVQVRLPRREGGEQTGAAYPFLGERIVTRSVGRWPGRFGLRLWVGLRHRDETGAYVEAPPRRRPWQPRRLRLVRIHTSTVPGRFSLMSIRADVLRVEEWQRAPGRTPVQLFLRGCVRLSGVLGCGIGAVIAVVQGRVAGHALPYTAGVALPASWLLTGAVRDFRQVAQIYQRPRVPSDLRRTPYTLYLRPRSDDGPPASVWSGPLDDDLDAVFSPTATLRVTSCVEGPPPPPGLARLPLPSATWQATLTTALPLAHLVLFPACGTAPDTLRQLTEAVRLVPPHRLLLLLPTTENAEEAYDAFRAAADTALAALPHPLRLPAAPPADVPEGLREPALLAAVHFTDDWTPALLRFRPVEPGLTRHEELLRLRAELQPLLDRLNAPPAQPPRPAEAE
ncbi:hypothetical protein [Streptomyces sp. A012304]|uniref:hypothetical protein n=1 Tax=Streptomyces sp. A012304 TaxID=375446 RepID=UPI0022305130|nr:hypothetical protein [Streptomyces sp. A012304]GKQ34312.1 hypothetical protein ALMP_08630 [Streptomyces sp. A012304]